MPVQAPKLALSMQEFADTVGISRQHAYNLFHDGKLATFKLGASRRVAMSEVQRILEGRAA